MKIQFITLPLVYGVGIAMAQGVEMDGTASQPVAAPGQKPMAKPKHPPTGDLRHCLDFNTNEAIIRCAVKSLKNNPVGLHPVQAAAGNRV